MLIDPSLSVLRRGSEPAPGGYRLIRRDIDKAPGTVVEARGYDFKDGVWVGHPWDIDDPATWLPQMMTRRRGQPIIPAWPRQDLRDLYYGAVTNPSEIYMSVGLPGAGGPFYFLRTRPIEEDLFIDVAYVAAEYGADRVSVRYINALGQADVAACSVAAYIERDGDTVKLQPMSTNHLWVRRGFSGAFDNVPWNALNWKVAQVTTNEVTLSLNMPDPVTALYNDRMCTITWFPLLLDGATHEAQGVRATMMGDGNVLPVEDGTGMIFRLSPGERRAVVAAPLRAQDRQLYADWPLSIPSSFDLEFIPRSY